MSIIFLDLLWEKGDRRIFCLIFAWKSSIRESIIYIDINVNTILYSLSPIVSPNYIYLD